MEKEDVSPFRDFQSLDGAQLKLGKEPLTVPPLNFKALRAHAAELKTMQGGLPLSADADTIGGYVAAVAKVVHAALRRNYPHISPEWVEDNLDMGNITEVTLVVMGLSGFEVTGKASDVETKGESAGE